MKIDDVTLMAFHDGELDAEAMRRVRVARLSDRRVSEGLEGLEQLGEFVRVWASTREAPAPVRAERRKPGRTRAGSAVGLAVALSSLTLLIPSALPRVNGSSEPLAAVTRPVSPGAALLRAPVEPAVAVETIDFGARHAAVFLVQSDRTETTVVWLAEAPSASATGTL